MKRRALGQHYLTDEGLIDRMISVAAPGRDESVVEIGTGRGALTEKLVRMCPRFAGYEVDPDNYDATVRRLGGDGSKVHLRDAFQETPRFDVLVSSLPYSRSLDFIEWISRAEYSRAVVLLQEDFVRKVLAPPGARDYRGVSALAQISSKIDTLERVQRTAFDPQPRVSSVMVRIQPRMRLAEEEVGRIRRLFSLRRKMVSPALMSLGMKARGEYGRRRVYSLTPAEVHEVCAPSAQS
jgi:16S rRNA (adenine1518-N6/adenine1519-N6)-dimethyltransferase